MPGAKGVVFRRQQLTEHHIVHALIPVLSAPQRLRMNSPTSDIVEIGRRLSEVRNRLKDGTWLGWLDREFHWSDETARKFMQVAKAFGTFQPGWNVPIDAGALYVLAGIGRLR